WSAFRLAYAFRLRTGLIRLQMPRYSWADRPLETWLKKHIPSDALTYTQWRKRNSPKFFFEKQVGAGRPRPVSWNKQTAIDEAHRILNGEIKYFAHEFHQVGFPPNWHKIPSTLPTPSSASDVSTRHTAEDGVLSQMATKHWSQISDDNVIASLREAIPNYEETASAKTKNASQRHYDIKFIWEPNRFSFVYTLVRAYAATQDEKYAEAFWKLILDWAEHNPPNTGPNWMDGQEIALRLMAWTFGYYQFSNSPSTTPQRIAQFTQYVAAQAERMYKNIDYAISTRSNHTISEAFGLWLIGLLFPELKDSEEYLTLGRKLLEQEAAVQIFPDGSYSMYSLNYHRFVLHIYLYAIRLGELNNSPFSDSLYSSISASIDYLSQLIDPQTGQMSVYGSNDGALVLPSTTATSPITVRFCSWVLSSLKSNSSLNLAHGMRTYFGCVVNKHSPLSPLPKGEGDNSLLPLGEGLGMRVTAAPTSSTTQTAKPSCAAQTSAPVPPMPINSTWICGFMVKTSPVMQAHISTAARASGEMDLHTHPHITR
ncbi:MAG: heparinase II/III family protein, partial [Anaerolineales bacterium]